MIDCVKLSAMEVYEEKNDEMRCVIHALRLNRTRCNMLKVSSRQDLA